MFVLLCTSFPPPPTPPSPVYFSAINADDETRFENDQLCSSRTDVSEILESRLKTDVMLVTGTLASHLHTVHTMAAHLNKTKSTLVQIDGVGDVLNEAVSGPWQNLDSYLTS